MLIMVPISRRRHSKSILYINSYVTQTLSSYIYIDIYLRETKNYDVCIDDRTIYIVCIYVLIFLAATTKTQAVKKVCV